MRAFTFKKLSPEDTRIYKGLAILMIVMHNYFHWLPPSIGENEQDFDPARFETYLRVIFTQPELFSQATLSYLGHYGVQIFLFLSAYGLTVKYRDANIHYSSFLKGRMFKIYPAYIVSIFVWAIYVGLVNGGIPHTFAAIAQHSQSLVYKITLIANFIPGYLYKINGPWWFVSLIVQFYIVFPFMLYCYKTSGGVGLFLLSVLSLLLTAFLQPHVEFFFGGTVLLHIPELSMGIYVASKKKFALNYAAISALVLLFVLSNIYEKFWCVSFICATLLLLIVFQLTVSVCNQKARDILLFTGSISMYIFYLNGFMRYPWYKNAVDYDVWYASILIFYVYFATVVASSWLMTLLENTIRSRSGQHPSTIDHLIR